MKFSLPEGKVLLYDGAKGVMLQKRGLKGEEAAEFWNLKRPEDVKEVHRLYLQAGSEILQTNTFPGNRITLEVHRLADRVYEINYAGVKLAREVAGDKVYVAASAGPTGLFLQPAGDLTFDRAYEIFAEQLAALEDAGADLVNFETFTDLAELRAAILAAREKTNLPVIASATFGKGARTLAGNPAEVCAIVCQSLGAMMVGANCSGGPESLVEPVKKMAAVAAVPLLVKANAGMPEMVDGQAVYRQTPEQFSSYTEEFVKSGVRLIGGCCGTTPDHIKALKKELAGLEVPRAAFNSLPAIASAYSYLPLSQNRQYVVGKLPVEGLKGALAAGDFQAATETARDLAAKGAEIICLDFGDAVSFDCRALAESFGVAVKTPLVVRADFPEVLEEFLRYYPGRTAVLLQDGNRAQISRVNLYGALPLEEDYLAGIAYFF